MLSLCSSLTTDVHIASLKKAMSQDQTHGLHVPMKAISLLILAIALPLIIIAVQQRQNIRPEAKKSIIANTCQSEINSFGVVDTCATGYYRHAFYVCSNGVSGQLGSSESCALADTWRQNAEKKCAGQSSCIQQNSAPTNLSLICDIDMNGQTNEKDSDALFRCANNQTCSPVIRQRADLNHDNTVTSDDEAFFFSECKTQL